MISLEVDKLYRTRNGYAVCINGVLPTNKYYTFTGTMSIHRDKSFPVYLKNHDCDEIIYDNLINNSFIEAQWTADGKYIYGEETQWDIVVEIKD